MFDILKQDVVDKILDELEIIRFKVSKIDNPVQKSNPRYGRLINRECLDKKTFTCLPLTKGYTAVIENNTPAVKQFQISTTDNAICVDSDNKIFVLTFDELIRLAKDNDLFQVK